MYAQPAGGTLTSALEVRDVLADFPLFAAFDRNGLACDIAFTSPEHASWSPALAKAVLDLTRLNMKPFYEAAQGWGWKEGAKRAELADADNRYLVARARGGGGAAGAAAEGGGGAGAGAAPPAHDILGFVSFRFLLEGDFDVLYVYDLQLSAAAQRKGLGKHLMQICELIGRKCGMQWCVGLAEPLHFPCPLLPAHASPPPFPSFRLRVARSLQLTVLKNNPSALDFYTRKMKYCVDWDVCATDESAAHEILTKAVDAKAFAAIKARAEEGEEEEE